jgi:hypothetical protein
MPLVKKSSAIVALLKVKGVDRFWGLTGKKKGKKLAQNPNMLEFHKREMRVKMVC